MIDFRKMTFNVEKFATMPKCIQAYYRENVGAGCLMTAFWVALGFIPEKQQSKLFFTHPVIAGPCSTEYLEYSLDMLSRITGVYKKHPDRKFSTAIISQYDRGKTVEALDLMWEMIDKLPHKTGFAVKEEVLMPCEIN